jgi:hypothetical protein
MDTLRNTELQWHSGILCGSSDAYKQLFNAYSKTTLEHLLGGFGNYLRHDLTLAHEAVWLAFRHYFNHPKGYQPHRGSLQYYLEIQAVRRIQKLLNEENRNWHFQQVHFVLARYFDNEQDMRLAKLLIRKSSNWCEYARILDTGALPIKLLLSEIKRNLNRVKRILENAPVDFSAMADKRVSVRKNLLRRRTNSTLS